MEKLNTLIVNTFIFIVFALLTGLLVEYALAVLHIIH